MFEWLKNANKQPWGSFFFVGCIFIIAAVTGVFVFKTDQTTVNQGFLLPLFLVGAALLAYSVYREWLDAHPKPDPGDPIDPSRYRVEVTRKPNSPAQTFPLVFEGKVKRDPAEDGLQLWYINGGGPRFWPGQRIIVGMNNKWSFNYTPQDFKSGDARVFKFCLVGRSGRALIKAYQDINAAHVPPGGHWHPVTEFTEDMVGLFEHAVTLEKPLTG